MSFTAHGEWDKLVDYENLTLYVDLPHSIDTPNGIKVWMLSDYKTAQHQRDRTFTYSSIKLLEEYDCKESQWRLLFMSFYAGNMGRGESHEANRRQLNQDGWHPVEPDTRQGQLLEGFCKK